ncbi:MAG: hypothetical protein F6K31_06475 [Symploca sp. SIO2G7]|nr:hypothetical protein [Symploca sp. SIO2G7]
MTYSPASRRGDSRLKQQLQAQPDLHHLTQWLMPQPFESYLRRFHPFRLRLVNLRKSSSLLKISGNASEKLGVKIADDSISNQFDP